MWTAPATSPRASRWNEDLMNTVRRVAIAAAVVLLAPTAVPPGPAQGRDAASGIGLRAPRAALEDRARRVEGESRSAALSRDARESAAREAAAIRARLIAGDFAVGDRIRLAVEGEKELSDTFTVGPGRLLPLPGIGDVPLEGVLRTELQAYLTRRLAQNLNDPVVRAQAFVRLSIKGEVTRPGYYGIPAEALLSDALMAAGGTAPYADMRKLRIDRSGASIWEGRALQRAIADGRTVDEAGPPPRGPFHLPPPARSRARDRVPVWGFRVCIPRHDYP